MTYYILIVTESTYTDLPRTDVLAISEHQERVEKIASEHLCDNYNSRYGDEGGIPLWHRYEGVGSIVARSYAMTTENDSQVVYEVNKIDGLA